MVGHAASSTSFFVSAFGRKAWQGAVAECNTHLVPLPPFPLNPPLLEPHLGGYVKLGYPPVKDVEEEWPPWPDTRAPCPNHWPPWPLPCIARKEPRRSVVWARCPCVRPMWPFLLHILHRWISQFHIPPRWSASKEGFRGKGAGVTKVCCLLPQPPVILFLQRLKQLIPS